MSPATIIEQYPDINIVKTEDGILKKADFIIDANAFIDKTSTLEAIYAGLGFRENIPYANYDGLEDLLSSQAWSESEVEILITNAGRLEKIDASVLTVVFEIFSQAIVDWKNSGKSLRVELLVE